MWWQFAGTCILNFIRERNKRQTWSYTVTRAQTIVKYVKVYTKYLTETIEDLNATVIKFLYRGAVLTYVQSTVQHFKLKILVVLVCLCGYNTRSYHLLVEHSFHYELVFHSCSADISSENIYCTCNLHIYVKLV